MFDDVRTVVRDDRPLEKLLAAATPPIARVLDAALSGRELSEEEGERLLGAAGDDLVALVRSADAARAADVGDEVTYVVNRNINFTNVCFVGCQFCGFARHRDDADAYTHSAEEIVARVRQAADLGATEICMQGGINPKVDGYAYRELLRLIKRDFPDIHLHAFSPMEIMYGARRANLGYREFLVMLKEAGLGTIPGTAAEILDDEIRERLSHKKVDTATWIEIVTAAHEVGLRSSSTMMYGHIETPGHVARHVGLIRSIQKRTGGFTEFVPLRFIHEHTALFERGLAPEPPPKGLVDLRVYAFSRLMLRGSIRNIQTSWVKLGTELAALTLSAGCNDFGGTLMEESITRLAGGDAGEYLPEASIRALIAGAGRIPVERTTTYGRVTREKATDADHRAGWRGGCGALPAGPVLAS